MTEASSLGLCWTVKVRLPSGSGVDTARKQGSFVIGCREGGQSSMRQSSVGQKQQLLTHQHRECLVFCGLDSVRVLSVFRQDCAVASCLSWSVMVTAWPCLMLVSCEMVYVQQDTP